MQRELRLSPSGLEWVVSSYALVLAALIPSGGMLIASALHTGLSWLLFCIPYFAAARTEAHEIVSRRPVLIEG
jgi:hypothetical protein